MLKRSLSLLRSVVPPPKPPRPQSPVSARPPTAPLRTPRTVISRDVFVSSPLGINPNANANANKGVIALGADRFVDSLPRFRGPDLTGGSQVHAFTRTTGDGVDGDYSEQVGRIWADLSHGGSGAALAEHLRGDDLSREEKHALIDYAIRSGNFGEILTDFRHGAEERNYDYDDLTTIASAVADAWRAGVVTDEELGQLAEDLGPEAAAAFAAQLALDPANVGRGGVVEAFGREAESLGFDQAAAIAFTSSPALIEEHLPTDSAQRAAFEHVRGYLEDADLDDMSNEERALYTVVAGNAFRLSANGNGYSDSELQSFVEDMGPSLAQEVISRLRNLTGDWRPDGAVELFGRTSQSVAAATGDSEDKAAWELNAALAFTVSTTLIERNLQGDAALRAFELLSQAAVDGLEGAEDAQGNYTLLAFPEILQGAARLFDLHSEAIINASLRGEGGLSPEALEGFIQVVGFSPFSSPTAKRQVRDAITEYANGHVQVGPEHDEGQLSFEVGQLLAITQNAADAAIARVGDDAAAQAEARNEARAFLTGLGTVLIQRGISTWNPLVGALAGPAAREVLERALPQESVDAARAEAERAYEAELARQGTDPDLGKALKAAREAYVRALHDAILNELQRGNLSDDEHAQLSTALDVLQSIQLELDNGYSEQRPN